jgi:hypothetical protein
LAMLFTENPGLSPFPFALGTSPSPSAFIREEHVTVNGETVRTTAESYLGI